VSDERQHAASAKPAATQLHQKPSGDERGDGSSVVLVAGAAIVLGALAAAGMQMRQRWRYKGRERVGQEEPAEMVKMGSEDESEAAGGDSDTDSMVIAEAAKPKKAKGRKAQRGALARALEGPEDI